MGESGSAVIRSGAGPGRRLPGAALLAALAAVLVVAGCSSGPPAPPPPVPVTYEPGANTADLPPTAPAAVSTPEGKLRDVTLTGDGKPVPGALSPDGKRFTTSGPLAFGTAYTWAGTAVGADGRTTPLAGGFHTLTPTKQLTGKINIGDGEQVGVAAPIEVQFDGHVADRAAAERALAVTTNVPVVGSWGWLPDQNGGSRVHWRPQQYWPAGTQVHVGVNLFAVPLGGGAFGKQNLTSDFTIGRAQVVKADVNSFRMVVERDGKQIQDVPASYGQDSDPNRTTRSGTHVVTEKFDNKRMTSAQYNYDVVERWAVRMSDNGEFIHANPKSADAQGSENVTHGCVNLSLGDAKTYYDSAMYGDPVEVTGSNADLSPRDGDIYDWSYDWNTWKSLSALPG